MKTTKVVGDGYVKGKLSAELRGQFEIRKDDILRRIQEGTLSFNKVMAQLQAIAEERVQVVSMIIDLFETVFVPATTSEFNVREKFMIDMSHEAKVNISFLGDNFKS